MVLCTNANHNKQKKRSAVVRLRHSTAHEDDDDAMDCDTIFNIIAMLPPLSSLSLPMVDG